MLTFNKKDVKINFKKLVITNETLNTNLKTNSNNNAYPKLLIINDQMIVTDQKQLNYHLYVLDYKDPTTGSPISYDIYVFEIEITIDKTVFLLPVTEISNYYSIMSIERNNIDSSARSSAQLNLKVFPQKSLINIKYVGISDVLAAFGSFFSVYSLIAGVLSGLYKDFFYKSDLINSIFKFVTKDHNLLPLNINGIKEKPVVKFLRTPSGKS